MTPLAAFVALGAIVVGNATGISWLLWRSQQPAERLPAGTIPFYHGYSTAAAYAPTPKAYARDGFKYLPLSPFAPGTEQGDQWQLGVNTWEDDLADLALAEHPERLI